MEVVARRRPKHKGIDPEFDQYVEGLERSVDISNDMLRRLTHAEDILRQAAQVVYRGGDKDQLWVELTHYEREFVNLQLTA